MIRCPYCVRRGKQLQKLLKGDHDDGRDEIF